MNIWACHSTILHFRFCWETSAVDSRDATRIDDPSCCISAYLFLDVYNVPRITGILSRLQKIPQPWNDVIKRQSYAYIWSPLLYGSKIRTWVTKNDLLLKWDNRSFSFSAEMYASLPCMKISSSCTYDSIFGFFASRCLSKFWVCVMWKPFPKHESELFRSNVLHTSHKKEAHCQRSQCNPKMAARKPLKNYAQSVGTHRCSSSLPILHLCRLDVRCSRGNSDR